MKRYSTEIAQLLDDTDRRDYREVGFGMVRSRKATDFTLLLKSGVATAAVVLSQYGTEPLCHQGKIVNALRSTEPVDSLDAIDRAMRVQLLVEEKLGSRMFRRKHDWTVPQPTWEDIFIGDGLAAIDKLIQTDTIVVGVGDEKTEGTMYYLPWNSGDIAGAARIICDDLFEATGDRVFDIQVVKRQKI